VDFDENGRVWRIVLKSSSVGLGHAWIIAVWTPMFTNFMHRYISKLKELMDQNGDQNHITAHQELYIGDVIQAAIQNEMKIDSVVFSDGFCLDIGTPQDLVKAVNIIKQDSDFF
jgi:glucose-1-phosphate thymidylyltransferase